MIQIRAVYLALFIIGVIMVALVPGCSNKAENRQSDNPVVTDRRQAQEINCVNNLRMIGIAFHVWEGDHGNQFPFNVSTNAGGAKELCAPDKDGFDSNAYLYLKTMGNQGYLTVPKLLVCPQDRSKNAATNWESLRAEGITYRFRSGTNVTDVNPHEILAVCPVDGNVLYCDGTVVEKHPTVDETGQHPMQVH